MLRLKTRAQFQAVLSGITLARTPHFVLHRQEPALAGLAVADAARAFWVGALVPKRWAKRAVTRNAIRRQIYELTRGLALAWAGSALVVRLRAAFDPRAFISASSIHLKRAVRAELQQLFAAAATARPAAPAPCAAC